jgi:hypothetical protein
MTKKELIALAKAGDAHIEASYIVTRYHITRKGVDDRGDPLDYPAIFLSLRDDDSVYCAEAYFTGGVDEVLLTDAEVETIRGVIEREMARC